GCLGCLDCVKRTKCIYDVYKKRVFDPGRIVDTADVLCMSCLRCVQECKKNILSKTHNPAYKALGNDYWSPDIIAALWNQAETGKIPVSGAGYRGPFSGPGFDSIWTDMSEIVRPTRDGIHGREYISTVISLGGRAKYLEFDETGDLLTQLNAYCDINIPMILELPDSGLRSLKIRKALAEAAMDLGTFFTGIPGESQEFVSRYRNHQIVKFNPGQDDISTLKGARIAELKYCENVLKTASEIKKVFPGMIVSVRLPLDEHASKSALDLASRGAEIIYLKADDNGRGFGKLKNIFITDMVHEIHMNLVKAGIRDTVTLLVSGGIAVAEHVPKILISGADGAGVDLSLMTALECRICNKCRIETDCPADIEKMSVEWGAQRIVNLMDCWHSQIIEVLGAMGIREVRRLRGETGRAMFLQDLEKECFAPLFGTVAEPALESSVSVPSYKGSSLSAEQASGCGSRFRNALVKYRVVRTSDCINCGKCTEVCTFGVHKQTPRSMLAPLSKNCRGKEICSSNNAFCADTCPSKALSVGMDPVWETFGDPRWPADLIVATWSQAETGNVPEQGIEYRKGSSGGGFDRMDFMFPDKIPDDTPGSREIDLQVDLNRSGDNRPQVTLGLPFYGGGMSFGSVSIGAMISRAQAYKSFNSFISTGEGGYPDELTEYDDNIITQVATGLFGVREDTIQRVKIVEFKYAQGAKPGLGGHLLGDKVTPVVAGIREAVQGSALFSPFPFHSVYSVEDHKKHIDWIKSVNPQALVSVKVSTPSDVDMVAIGSYFAGAHIIHIDGSYGGTGAAPDIAKKNIAMPVEYAITKVHNFLLSEGVRDKISLVASGGLRTAYDAAKAISLGADAVVIGTADLIALECIRCGRCESGRGCPRGIASTDEELAIHVLPDWGTRRLINMYNSWTLQLKEILWRLGMKSIHELVGRSDTLNHRDYCKK
ncbi:glutamate synthase-related protein, partial [Elusimicrobiota bacterium]